MIKTIIIDDEAHCLDTLEIMLGNNCKDVHLVEKCLSASDGLTAIEKQKPDLVFLDIEMPIMNGFDMLVHLGQISFALIFTTSYSQYAIKAIQFSALDYLLKPVDPGELIAAVSKVRQLHTAPTLEQFEMLIAHMQDRQNGFHKIAVPTLEGFEMIPATDLIKCVAENNYTHIFLKGGKKIAACRTLKEIEEQLRSFSFFNRVHHSYLVNLNEISKYVRGEGGYLIMSDGSTVNVSKSRKEALMRIFEQGRQI